MIFAHAYGWPPDVVMRQRLGDLMRLMAHARRTKIETADV